MKACLTKLILLFLPTPIYAKAVLDFKVVSYRANDKIRYCMITNDGIGGKGENISWDFSNADVLRKNIEIEYSTDNTRDISIAGICNNNRLYYRQDSTGIAKLGYENNYTRVKYDRPEHTLSFPIEYGKEDKGIFHGIAMFCENVMMREFGIYSLMVDGYGKLLLPGGITLENVYRIHSCKATANIIYDKVKTEKHLYKLIYEDTPFSDSYISSFMEKTGNDVTYTETYTWYAVGYRYPVIWAISNYTHTTSKKNFTFYYCQPKEMERTYDKENESLRNTLAKKIENKNLSSNDDKDNKVYNIRKEGDIITISPKRNTSLYIILTNSSGIVFKSAKNENGETINIDSSGIPHGDYIIYVKIGETTYSTTIKI